jgi:hypothetical protein
LESKGRNDRKTSDPHRLRTYSFVATLAIISLIIGVSYYQTLPSVGHIPSDFTFVSQEWMPYVPSDAEYVGYVNYRVAYSVTGNSSLFGFRPLLEFPQLGFEIIPVDVVYEAAIQLPEPRYSGSALLIQISASKQSLLTEELASANRTKIPVPDSYDGYAVYSLLTREVGDNTTTPGYLALVNNHMLFSNDKKTGLQNVQVILDQVTAKQESLFDDQNIRRSVYATGVTDQNYVALFVGRFPTQLNDTEMATKSIIGNGDSIQVSRAFLFPSSDIALARWGQAHTLYRDASSYRILDSLLVVTYNYPLNRIQTEIVGI